MTDLERRQLELVRDKLRQYLESLPVEHRGAATSQLFDALGRLNDVLGVRS